MEMQEMMPSDYLQVLRRRKWSMIVPATIIFFLAVITALIMPSVYKSTATILIEGQDIPLDFVKTSVTSYAEQRLQSINQRIMSSTQLIELIDRFDLYREFRAKHTTEELIDKMRGAVALEPISAEVSDQRTARSGTATIAFTLAYEGQDSAKKIQQVTTTLVSLFLKENIQVRERQVNETSEFLKSEANRLKDQVGDIEGAITEFKKEHMKELPELLQVNMQSLNNIEQQITNRTESINVLTERKIYLQTELAGILPQMDVNLDADNARRRLEELSMALLSLRSRLSDKHPDVAKIKNEIERLEKSIEAPVEEEIFDGRERKNNQAYDLTKAQLSSIQVQIDNAKAHIGELVQSKAVYQARIEATPQVEETYNRLRIDRANTQAKYDDLMGKLMEAQVSQGLEREQKGERFTLIDPAQLPEKPFKPNRLGIILAGVLLGIGAGVGLAALREFADHTVRTADELAMAIPFPVLAALPEIETEKEKKNLRNRRIALVLAILLMIVAGIAVFHYLIMDLNVFWAKLMRNLPF